jgi:signal transduction histidine kinase
VEQIVKVGRHLSGLVDHKFALGQIQQDTLPMDVGEVSPNSLISDCNALVDNQAKSMGLTLDLSGFEGDALPTVKADPTRLKQVVLNILSNAVKYNATGKEISLGSEIENAGFLHIEIMDDGPGILLDKQEDLFTPFNRLGMEAKEIEGTGIGLSISKVLMGAMGGDIGHRNVESGGACFWVSIPVTSKSVEPN